MQRNEIVDHRRAHALTLRREHPVGVVEDVDGAEEALDRGAAETAPGLPPLVGEGQEPQPEGERQAGQNLGDPPHPLRAGRREGDDLVPPARDVAEPFERAANVVADSGQLVRERADVEGDPHGR